MHFSGEMSPADILNANLAFYADERSDRARYQILDCLEVTSLSDDLQGYEETMVTLAAMDTGASLSLGPVKVALVAVLPEAIELFGRYTDVSSDIDSDWPTRVFGDLDSARAWIAPPGVTAGTIDSARSTAG